MTITNRPVPVAVVGTDSDLRSLIVELLRQAGASSVECDSADAATTEVKARRVVAVVLGIGPQEETGVPQLAKIARHMALPVAALVSSTDPGQHEQWLRLGPIHYVAIPQPPEKLFGLLTTFVDHARERAFLIDFREAFVRDWNLSHRFLGHSPALNSMLRSLPRLAAEDAPVLITGEPATGRRRVGQLMHDLSRRAQHPFVAFDCGAVTTEHLDEYLFEGALVRSVAGTLLLRDVQELPLSSQARVMELLSSTRPGEDVRIVATAQPQLERRVEDGRFREALFTSLSLRVRVPSLRDRPTDIPMLASATLERLQREKGVRSRTFSPEALDFLIRSPWPGNMLELTAAIERAAQNATGEVITLSDFGEADAEQTDRFPDLMLPFHQAKAELVARFEREYAARILSDHGGNVSAAARAAQLDRRSLTRLLDRQGVRRRKEK